MQEDHVSMGWGAARKLRSALANLRRILAIELVVAARGIDLRAPLRPAPATEAAVAELRTTVPGPGSDRFLAPELAAAEDLLRGGRLAAAVSAVTGDLWLRPPPACPARSRTARWPRARRPAPPCTRRRRRCSRRTLSVVWRRDAYLSAAARGFRDVTVSHFRRSGPAPP
jgi:hypothetical protein